MQELEDAKIALMADGHEKEIEQIRLNYQRRIDEITGNSETEKALRTALTEQLEREVAECELSYQQNLAKTNLANRLAVVEKGSKEELDLRLAQIEAERAAELAEAEKSGADMTLINEKFNQKRLDLEDEFAAKMFAKLHEQYANEQTTEDMEMAASLNALKKKYLEEVDVAADSEKKRRDLREKYEAEAAAITRKYAIQSAQSVVNMYENMLNIDGISGEAREKLQQELTAAKIALEKEEVDAVEAANDEKQKSDKKSDNERLASAKKIQQTVMEYMNAANQLASAIYDAKIQRIEEEQEANNEAGEAEQERIAELVEQNVITEEEGEARKRAAEDATAKKNEELEKKKQQLQHKQAVWDKANSIAKCTMQTALAIMNAWATAPWPVNIAMAATAGVLGAVQLATIMATPIPAYAKGTDRHGGGPAIVGDGGVPELVVYGGRSWITPDTPTLVDIPAGAMVIPEVNGIDAALTGIGNEPTVIGGNASVIVNNDYKRLEEKMDTFIRVMKRHSDRQCKTAYNVAMSQYINFKV